jgi:hypothetical protein
VISEKKGEDSLFKTGSEKGQKSLDDFAGTYKV